MKLKFSLWSAIVISLFILKPSPIHAQGSLTPPGAPAATMKSLDQIEARTPVDATHTPGQLNSQFVITQPGSYYLTGNIASSSNQSGIFIQTNDVTLDLNGFEMIGSRNYGDAIDVSSLVVQNTVIRNGSLRNWANGVAALNGYCELEHVRVYGCTNVGLELGDRCTVRNCTAMANVTTGIQVGNACVITECLVASNGIGLSGGAECTMSGCQAIENYGDGIDLSDNFNVTKCTCDDNSGNGFTLGNGGQIRECVADTNYTGIEVSFDCTVKECNANANVIFGISCKGNSVVMNNQADGNFEGEGQGDGIFANGDGACVENNQTLNNAAYGIESSGAVVVVRNTSTGNGLGGYGPPTGATIGPIQTPATATSPWANF